MAFWAVVKSIAYHVKLVRLLFGQLLEKLWLLFGQLLEKLGLLFGQLLEKLGLLFISTSGHTATSPGTNRATLLDSNDHGSQFYEPRRYDLLELEAATGLLATCVRWDSRAI